ALALNVWIPACAGMTAERFLFASFPRKWESRTKNLKKPFYPISFCAEGSGFPLSRERRRISFRVGKSGFLSVWE
ncbi:TPA: hypothetical protein ACP1WE_001695, partial [Neisseria meningitidis]